MAGALAIPQGGGKMLALAILALPVAVIAFFFLAIGCARSIVLAPPVWPDLATVLAMALAILPALVFWVCVATWATATLLERLS